MIIDHDPSIQVRGNATCTKGISVPHRCEQDQNSKDGRQAHHHNPIPSIPI